MLSTILISKPNLNHNHFTNLYPTYLRGMVEGPACPALGVEVPSIVEPVVLANNDGLTASRQLYRRELVLIVFLVRGF